MSKASMCKEWIAENMDYARTHSIEELARKIEEEHGFQVSRLYLRKLRSDMGVVVERKAVAANKGEKSKARFAELMNKISQLESMLFNQAGYAVEMMRKVDKLLESIQTGIKQGEAALGEVSIADIHPHAGHEVAEPERNGALTQSDEGTVTELLSDDTVVSVAPVTAGKKGKRK